jgi:hypothetical protein
LLAKEVAAFFKRISRSVFAFCKCSFIRHVLKERVIFRTDFIYGLALFVRFAFRLFQLCSGRNVILFEVSVFRIQRRQADNQPINICCVGFVESQFQIVRH